MRALRILSRSIRDSFKSAGRNFSLSMAAITCSTITLILVAVSIVLSYNVSEITTNLEKELTIVAYVKKEATESNIEELKSELNKINNVENYTYKSADEWKAEMKNESETLNATLDYLETNPLLDSFIVKVKDVTDLKSVTEQIRKFEFISSAEYGEGMVENIVGAFDIVSKGTIVIVVALVLVTAFLISNTIKLTIYSRKNEIEIMRLVGASNIAIKLPFIFEGFILGVLGSIIPIIVTIYGYNFLYDKLNGHIVSNMITLVQPFNFVFYVAFILLAVGSVVGMFGSYRAVRKYLKI
ncbi:MAG: ABC transporter permease [Bacilli bacterium]|nr:ABC transporter permease [Bacilli bacterium]